MSSLAHHDLRGHYQPVDESEGHELFNDDEDHEQNLHLATLEEKKRLWWRNAFITGACIAFWFLFATLLSVYNKWMFSPDRYGFPFPLFVTSVHMWIQFGLAALVRAIWPAHFRPPEKPTLKQYGKRVLPAAVATCFDIGFSNLSLENITLTFYTMVKNSSLIFVLIFAFLFRLEAFSFRLIGVIGLILIGVILMVATETSFSLSGFLLVLTASACAGLRWSLTQLLMRKDKRHDMGLSSPPAALFWMAPAMGIVLAGLSMIVEGWIRVFSSKFFDGMETSMMTCIYILIPGSVAFFMVISEFYVIHRAGVVPMAVAGILKEVGTISVSTWIFGDHFTLLNVTGAVIVFCGIILFTYHKYRKSIESSVPLDAHGNPIDEGEVDRAVLGAIGLRDVREPNETDFTLVHANPPLARGAMSDSYPEQDSAQHPLFSAGLESEDGHDKTWGRAPYSNGVPVADGSSVFTS